MPETQFVMISAKELTPKSRALAVSPVRAFMLNNTDDLVVSFAISPATTMPTVIENSPGTLTRTTSVMLIFSLANPT